MVAPHRTVAVQSYPVWLPQTQTWMYEQLRRLPDFIEAHVICERTENLEQFGVKNIHSLDEEPRWKLVCDKALRRLHLRRHLLFFARQCREVGAEVVHSHFGNIGWADCEVVRKLGLRHVTTFYGLDVNLLPNSDARWRARYAELFESVDRVLCEGPHMAQCVIALGCPAKKVTVHHLGVNLDEIEYAPRKWSPGEPLRLLIAATFREKKGVLYAIEALRAIKDEVPLEITIIGDATPELRSQNEKAKILAALDNSGLRPRTRLLGFRPHRELLAEAYRHHIFLSPSVTASDGDTEGGAPVTIIELAASGMPIVSTRHCDIPNVLPTGTPLAEERNVEELAAILRGWIRSAGTWEAPLRRARRHVEDNFDVREQGKRLGEIYAGRARKDELTPPVLEGDEIRATAKSQ